MKLNRHNTNIILVIALVLHLGLGLSSLVIAETTDEPVVVATSTEQVVSETETEQEDQVATTTEQVADEQTATTTAAQDETATTTEVLSDMFNSSSVSTQTTALGTINVNAKDIVDGTLDTYYTRSSYPIYITFPNRPAGGLYNVYLLNINTNQRYTPDTDYSNVNLPGDLTWGPNRPPLGTPEGNYRYEVEYKKDGQVVGYGVSVPFKIRNWPGFLIGTDKQAYNFSETIQLNIDQIDPTAQDMAVDLYFAPSVNGGRVLIERRMIIPGGVKNLSFKISDHPEYFNRGDGFYGFLICAVNDDNCQIRTPNTNSHGFSVTGVPTEDPTVTPTWHGTFFNYDVTHPDMNLPGFDDIDRTAFGPLDAGWDRDWYDDQYRVKEEIVGPLNYPINYFPLDEGYAEDPAGSGHNFHFGAHYRAYATVATEGDYDYYLRSDDDSYLYVNNVLYENNSGLDIAHTPETGTVHMVPGQFYILDVFFAERHVNGSALEFRFTTPGVTINPCSTNCPTNAVPQVTVSQPAAGATLLKGSTYPVTWTIVNAPAGLTGIDVDLISPTSTHKVLSIGQNLPIGQTTLNWTVPTSVASGNYRVQVSYRNSPTNVVVSGLSGIFAITTSTGGGNQPPVIDSISGPSEVEPDTNETWQIKATDPEGRDLTIHVNWGDGESDIRQNVDSGTTTPFTHEYDAVGDYTMTVTATDDVGQTDVETRTIDVNSDDDDDDDDDDNGGGGGGGGGCRDRRAPNAPRIVGSSHPLNVASTLETVAISVSADDNGCAGLDGYSFSWTNSPTTEPDNTVDTDDEIIVSTLGPGTWYFHVKAIDRRDNASDTTHYGPIIIGGTGGPAPTSTPRPRPRPTPPPAPAPTTTCRLVCGVEDGLATSTLDDLVIDEEVTTTTDETDRGFFGAAAAGLLGFLKGAWWWIILLILLALLIWNILRDRDDEDQIKK